MAVKFSTTSFFRRIPSRISRNAVISSISSAISIPNSGQYENKLSSNSFEAKIQFLKNKLHPESLIHVLDSTSDLNSSVKLFEWASLQTRFRHTADTYQTLILKLGNAGQMDKMEQYCQQMVEGKFLGSGESLLNLIDEFVKNHRLDEALRVLFTVNLSGFKLSVNVINALMAALLEEKKGFKDVLFVYKEMVKAAINPNIDTLNYLIEACFEDNRIDSAMDQYIRLSKKGCYPNSRTFEIVISNLASRDRVNESIAILNDMFRLGFEPETRFYTILIPLFCELQNVEIGLRLFKMMKASKLVPELVVYRAIIECLSESFSMEDAIVIYEEMKGSSSFLPDDKVNLDMVKGFCRLSEFDKARKFLSEESVMDVVVHNVLLKSYCENGNFPAAKEMFDEMFSKNATDPDSWNIVIRFLCEKAQIKKALEYLTRMVVCSFEPNESTYSTVILGNCRAEKLDNAVKLFRIVEQKCMVLDSLSYSEIIQCLCRGIKIEEAIKVFDYMSRQGCSLQSSSFDVLLGKICENGKVQLGIELLSLARKAGIVSSIAVYNSILLALSHRNHLQMILSQMVVLGCAFNKETYCILIQSLSAQNCVRDCISFFSLMLNERFVPDSETLRCLFHCLGSNYRMHSIYPSIHKLTKAGILDSAMYNMVIDSLWREGWKREAEYFLDLMLEKGWVPNASIHSLLIGGSNGNREMGSEEIEKCSDVVSCILETGLA